MPLEPVANGHASWRGTTCEAIACRDSPAAVPALLSPHNSICSWSCVVFFRRSSIYRLFRFR